MRILTKNKLRVFVVCIIILLLEIGWRTAVAQVTIPNDVAAYFLERSEMATVYEIQNRTKDAIIDNLEKQLVTKNLTMVTYVSDASLYQELLDNKETENAMKDDLINQANKEIRRQKFIKVVIIVGVIIEHILIITLL